MIEFATLYTYVIGLLSIALLTVATWAVSKLGTKFNLDNNEALRNLIEDAIHAAINFAIQKLHEQGKRFTIETEKESLAMIVNYVINSIPEALAHFGITPERVEEMVKARLNHYEYEEDNG